MADRNNYDNREARAKAKKARQARKGQERADRKTYGRGKSGKAAKMEATAKKAALDKADRLTDRIISSSDTPTVDDGAAMKKTYGSSMNASQDKSASMDDYSHEKKLKADGRYEAAHGKMAKANNDFDHAHALKKDAAHDAKGRHSIMRHMKGFGASMKIDNMGASLPGTPAGSKSKRSSMTNLATTSINKRPAQYTDSGQNYRDANNNLVKGTQVDEGEISSVIRKSPMRPHVVGGKESMYSGEKLFLSKEKMGQKATMTKAPKKRMQQSMKSIPKKRMQASMRGVKATPTKMRSGQMIQGNFTP